MIDQNGLTINAETQITNLMELGVTQQTHSLDGNTVIKFQVFICFKSWSQTRLKIVDVKQLVLIIPVGITTVIWQERHLAKDAKNGTLNRHTNTTNQLCLITIVAILTRTMAVYGAIPRILIRNGNTVLKFKVFCNHLYNNVHFIYFKPAMVNAKT